MAVVLGAIVVVVRVAADALEVDHVQHRADDVAADLLDRINAVADQRAACRAGAHHDHGPVDPRREHHRVGQRTHWRRVEDDQVGALFQLAQHLGGGVRG